MSPFGQRQDKYFFRVLSILFSCAAFGLSLQAAAQGYGVLHDFSSDSGHPGSALIETVSGDLWGTTTDGGQYGRGSIFVLTPDGSGGFTYAEPHSFTGGADGTNPQSGLLQASDGFLYGVVAGGSSGFGVLYRIDSSGNGFEAIHDFTSVEGSAGPASLIEVSDGLLYGTTITGAAGFGAVFSFDPLTGSLAVIHDFSNAGGAYPSAALLEGADGRLYGTTFGGGGSFAGTVFGLDKSGANFAMLHEFTGADGASPSDALIQLADGFLYGTASSGGANFAGSIFKLDTAGNGFQVLHDLAPGEGRGPLGSLVQASDGLLYGTASTTDSNDDGTIFRLDSAGASFEVVHTFTDAEGKDPQDGLLKTADGSLYGTTRYGGAGGNGAVYAFDSSTGSVTTKHSFVSRDAFGSTAGMVRGPGGFLYGVARNGGAGSYGAIFKTDASGATYTLLHSFTSAEGGYPGGALLVGMDGRLYGITTGLAFGGGSSYGSIFRMNANGTGFTVLHALALSEGNDSFAALIQGSDGFLYGTTVNGGAFANGVVFRVATNGHNFSVLHDFPAAGPQAALLQASDGLLYGTTFFGGANGYGSVFRLETSGASFAVIHDFTHSAGAWPSAALIQRSDGKLYGTTSSGTQNEMGVVYRLDPSGSNFQVIHKFTGPDGAVSYAPLFEAADGFLYGTTIQGGASSRGTVFRLKPGGGSYAVAHSFGGADGAAPSGSLVQGLDGGLYGTARDGGALNGGTAFRLDRVTYMLTVSKSGTGTGKVVSAPAGINCGAACSAAFAAGSAVALTPTPSSTSLFKGWSGDPDCSDGNVTMTADKTCTARFDLGPDLVVSALTAPATAAHGASITIGDTTKNRGGASIGTTKTKYYLSSDADVGPGDVVLGTRSVPELAAGALSSGSLPVTIPAHQPPGSYFVIAVADGNGARTETDETNNTRSKAITIQ